MRGKFNDTAALVAPRPTPFDPLSLEDSEVATEDMIVVVFGVPLPQIIGRNGAADSIFALHGMTMGEPSLAVRTARSFATDLSISNTKGHGALGASNQIHAAPLSDRTKPLQ